jgi:hypothetical protein
MIRFAVTSLRRVHRAAAAPAGRHACRLQGCGGLLGSDKLVHRERKRQPTAHSEELPWITPVLWRFLIQTPPPIANSKSSRKGKLVGEMLRQLSDEPRALREKLAFLALKSGVEGRGAGSEVA